MTKIFSTLIAFMIVSALNLNPCCAEDFQFVDAEGVTGYYVDMDSVENESRSIIAARIAVVKADANRMFVYDVRFNHVERTYRIIASQTLEYDSRDILETDNIPRDARAYASGSEMSELIDFIMYGGDLP